jgi:hypothetical protein
MRARVDARWSADALAEVVAAVLATAPEHVWSADDVRVRLTFGHQGGGPAASSVREALRRLEADGRAERVDVWGRRGWGNTTHGYRAAGPAAERQLTLAA